MLRRRGLAASQAKCRTVTFHRIPVSLGAWWLAGTTLLSSCSCGDARKPSEDPCGCCVTDRVAHCVRLDDCRDSRDCPSGTECIPRIGTSGRSCPGSDDAAVQCACSGTESPAPDSFECRVPSSGEGERHTLATGFGVSEFRLTEVAGATSAEFAWSAPTDARFVVCALFGCAPVFADEGTGPTIVNYDHCVIADSNFESLDASFSLGDASLAHVVAPAGCADPSGERLTLRPALSMLGVGCWAYDDTKLIGATVLLPVTPSSTFLAAEVPEVDAEEGESPDCRRGRTCYIRDDQAYGVCDSGRCYRRCLDARDCVRPSSADDLADEADAGPAVLNRSCQLEGHLTGICVVTDEGGGG